MKKREKVFVFMIAMLLTLAIIVIVFPGAAAAIWSVLKIVLIVVGVAIFAAMVSMAIIHS